MWGFYIFFNLHFQINEKDVVLKNENLKERNSVRCNGFLEVSDFHL